MDVRRHVAGVDRTESGKGREVLKMMIPYGRQEISEADIQAVVDVLRSDFLTQGPVVPAFENSIAKYCGVDHAVATNSATSALHIACLALGVGKGDLVWTSPITFVASANCALYCGADVDFVDIDPRTYNMSTESLAEKLSRAEQSGRIPKVVIPVHLCGQPCDMASIHDLGQRYGFKIIEDASHAIGGKYKGEPIGNCRYSDITVFSFHPVKIITTGEGGMALTNDEKLSRHMQLLRSHGITRDSDEMTHAPDGPWYYQQIELGFNYRMTDLQAALGLSQMRRLDEFVSKRHQLANHYDHVLADYPIVTPWRHTDSYSGFHLYVIRLKLDEIGNTHRQIFEAMRAAGIGVNLHYIPVHMQPYYENLKFAEGDFPVAEQFYRQAMSLPLFPKLEPRQQELVCEALKNCLNA
jgi:UDP-4-amino-4,6-dideoxy-N-acetyl-beta-L-altrosamine transaminase